jgi:hypothetical protein
MRYVIVLLLLVAVSVARLHAQEDGAYELQGGLFSLDGMLLFPRGAFAENLDKAGLGLSLDLGYAPQRLPLAMGLTGSYAFYESTPMDVPVTHLGSTRYVDMTATNRIVTLNLFFRIQPEDGAFRPFFEGLVGMHILWTSSTVDDDEDEELGFSGDTFLSDAAFSYGGGGGIDLRVYTGANTNGSYGELYISARVRYLYGGEAEYLDGDSISFDSNGAPRILPEDKMKSGTDMMQILVGITMRL